MTDHHYIGTEQTDWKCNRCDHPIGDGESFVLILPADSDECEVICDKCYDHA